MCISFVETGGSSGHVHCYARKNQGLGHCQWHIFLSSGLGIPFLCLGIIIHQIESCHLPWVLMISLDIEHSDKLNASHCLKSLVVLTTRELC